MKSAPIVDSMAEFVGTMKGELMGVDDGDESEEEEEQIELVNRCASTHSIEEFTILQSERDRQAGQVLLAVGGVHVADHRPSADTGRRAAGIGQDEGASDRYIYE